MASTIVQSFLQMILYLFYLAKYYIQYGVLYLFAFITYHSFALYHPSDPFYNTISPRGNPLIHSFPADEADVPPEYWTTHHNVPLPTRHWRNPVEVSTRYASLSYQDHPTKITTLEGPLNGPALRQG